MILPIRSMFPSASSWARPGHCTRSRIVVRPGDLGIAQDLVLHLLGLADQEPALGEVVEGGVEVAPGGSR